MGQVLPFIQSAVLGDTVSVYSSGHLGSPLWKEEGTTSKAWAGQQSPKQVYCKSLPLFINILIKNLGIEFANS